MSERFNYLFSLLFLELLDLQIRRFQVLLNLVLQRKSSSNNETRTDFYLQSRHFQLLSFQLVTAGRAFGEHRKPARFLNLI